MKISPLILKELDELERELQPVYVRFDECALHNQAKVLEGFHTVALESRHFAGTTGYGYDDAGRDALERAFAHVFRGERALVRPGFASGTHAIATAFYGLLRPGDEMVCLTGPVYDTLRPVIGTSGDATGSLADLGIGYHEIAPLPDGAIDVEAAIALLNARPAVRVVYAQRSGGYAWRRALGMDTFSRVVSVLRQAFRNRPLIVVVDNCYGEFTERTEPLENGADLIIGSLIKNPGGGLAPTGAYIVGRAELIERVAGRMTAPGVGAEVGSYAGGYAAFFQGLFLAPSVVCSALKGATLLAAALSRRGYDILPRPGEPRSDIIQAIRFGAEAPLLAFCRAVQAASPVEAHVVPNPWAMPGYQDKIIMAAGTFVQGASIELSADAPIKPPYIAYWQGGLTYEHCKLAVASVCQALDEAKERP